jgi:hypothetical protein
VPPPAPLPTAPSTKTRRHISFRAALAKGEAGNLTALKQNLQAHARPDLRANL